MEKTKSRKSRDKRCPWITRKEKGSNGERDVEETEPCMYSAPSPMREKEGVCMQRKYDVWLKMLLVDLFRR